MKVIFTEDDQGHNVYLSGDELLNVLRSMPGGEDIPEDRHIHFAGLYQRWGKWELELILYPPAGAPA